jgi:hypothetical protein
MHSMTGLHFFPWKKCFDVTVADAICLAQQPGGTPAERRGPGALEGGVTTFSSTEWNQCQKIFVYCSMKKVDMGKFVLLIGNDATEIFDYYGVDKMHGLNRKDAQAEEVDKSVGNGVYIYGWTNYDPRDKKLTAKAPYKPFLFLNKKHFKGKFTDITLVNHEAMHIVILLNNWDIRDKEEETISEAEDITNRIVKLLKLDKFTK